MNGKKQILMVMPVLKGGGAERVASLLVNEFAANGYKTEFLLTSCNKNEIINRDLDSATEITVLRDNIKQNAFLKIFYKLLRIISSLICKCFEVVKVSVPALFAYMSFVSEYYAEIKAMRNKLKQEPDTAVVVFLQPSIPLVLLAARGLPNRIIISERGNPERLMKSRYGYKFIKKYYDRADVVVFQTPDAQNTYPDEVAEKGVVISNPVKSDLPEPYSGERNKNITTFCRISKQKNLPVLIEAFSIVHRDFPEYRLRIIGQPYNDDDMVALDETKAMIEKHNLADFVDFLPFSKNVHSDIIEDALYVNSSDYEGMSNAMLEAMAIGMPCVCTDCPIGGARVVIKDGENGLLTPVGDSYALYEAIKKVLSDKTFANKLCVNASKVRDEMSLKNTAKLWMEIL